MSHTNSSLKTIRTFDDLRVAWLTWAIAAANPAILEPVRREHLRRAEHLAVHPVTRKIWMRWAGVLLVGWGSYLSEFDPWRGESPQTLRTVTWRDRYDRPSLLAPGQPDDAGLFPDPDERSAELLSVALSGTTPPTDWLLKLGSKWPEVDATLRILWVLARADDDWRDFLITNIREALLALELRMTKYD